MSPLFHPLLSPKTWQSPIYSVSGSDPESDHFSPIPLSPLCSELPLLLTWITAEASSLVCPCLSLPLSTPLFTRSPKDPVKIEIRSCDYTA